MRSLVRTTPRRLRLASVTVLVGVAALSGVAAWNPTTTAGSADAVSFTGGCGLLGTGLGGSSSPDTSHLSVPAGSRVEFTNRLDHPAELRLDGEPVAKVPAGGTEEVTFFEGPVTAEMHLDCALGKPSGAVTVEVLQDAAAAPRTATGNRAPGNRVPAGAATVPPDGSDRGDGERPGSGSEPSRSPLPQPGTSSGRGTQSPAAPSGQPAPASPDQSDSHGDLAPTRPAPAGQPGGPASDGAPGSSEAGPEASGGWWPGSPSGSGSGDRAGVEDAPGSDAGSDPGSARPDTDKASQTGPAATDQVPDSDRVGADEITHTADAAPPGGSIGLLALIATVCVVGVSAGAVRAILTQRSNGAGLA